MNDLLKRLPRRIRSDQWLVYGCVALVIMSCMLYVSMNALLVDITGSRARFDRESQVESATFLPRDPFADLSTFEQNHGFAIERRREFDATAGQGLALRVFEHTERVNIPAITAGRDLQADDEILLGQTVATALKAPPGDDHDSSGTSFTVVGFASVPDYMYPIKTTDAAGHYRADVPAAGSRARSYRAPSAYRCM